MKVSLFEISYKKLFHQIRIVLDVRVCVCVCVCVCVWIDRYIDEYISFGDIFVGQ